MKKYTYALWNGFRETWNEPWGWLMLGLMSLSYFMWMSWFSAIFATLATLCLGTSMHCKGAIHGMAVMQSIHDGTYNPPEAIRAEWEAETGRRWTEDEL